MKKSQFLILILAIILSLAALPVLAQQEDVRIFSSEPLASEQSKGRSLTKCLAGWRQFIAAGIGFEDASDYWRDFFLWPSHYADVANVQEQLNKARYAVMAAFLRCDLNRLKSVTEAYYRLEAELYFVRHFVDTKGGFLLILTEEPDSREKFMNDMIKYLILLKPAEDEDKERAIYGGYFDSFTAKYRERAKQYAGFGEDPVYAELAAKFDELIKTIKSFSKLGHELGELGKESSSGVVALFKNPVKTLKEAGIGLWHKFDACVETPNNRYCANSETGEKIEDPFFPKSFTKRAQKQTFEQAMIAITKREVKKTEDITKAQMYARYELLYGDVSDKGVKELTQKMDNLLKILKDESTKPLKQLQKCAETVRTKQCG